MANAVIARQQGDDLQARFFWLQATRLFLEPKHVKAIGYEVDGVRAFDDVSLHYDPPAVDIDGGLIHSDYFQVKYHVSGNGTVTAESLMEPEFIAASRVSLLERLRDAQRKHCPDARGVRFILVVQWAVPGTDILAKLVSGADDRLRLDVLFDDRPRTEMAKLRQKWKKHLGLMTDEELRKVLTPLRIRREAASLTGMMRRVNEQLMIAGWRPCSESRLVNEYDDLTRKLLQAGQRKFNADTLRELGKQERLWLSAPMPSNAAFRTVGIRSFSRGAERLHETVGEHLCLLDHFDERWPREPAGWPNAVAPAVSRFLHLVSTDSRPVQITLAAHASIAFMTGYHFDAKRGIEVYPVQVGRGAEVWRPRVVASGDDEHWGADTFEIGDGSDTAVAVAVSHDIVCDVLEYVPQHVRGVGRLISLRALPRPGQSAVRDGGHAHAMAEAAISLIRARRKRSGSVHFFYAGPNALWFYVGQMARVLGSCWLYEHNFGHLRPGPAYERSLHLPFDESALPVDTAA